MHHIKYAGMYAPEMHQKCMCQNLAATVPQVCQKYKQFLYQFCIEILYARTVPELCRKLAANYAPEA